MRGSPGWVVLALALALTAGLAGCQTPAGRSPGGVVDDAAITSRVKAGLFAEDGLSGFAIGVDTFEGEVTLTGGVQTAEEKELAARIAGQVRGVRGVNNLLLVRQEAESAK